MVTKKKKFVTHSIRLSDSLSNAIQQAAKKDRRSFNSWLSLHLEKTIHSIPVTEINTERKFT
jgi:predicted HicB family RNase H-like nuclease